MPAPSLCPLLPIAYYLIRYVPPVHLVHHQLPVLDDLVVPGEDDEGVGGEGVEVRGVAGGAGEAGGGAHLGGEHVAQGGEGDAHGIAAGAQLVHQEHTLPLGLDGGGGEER